MFFFSPQDSTNVWVMFGAIASHKFVISFCMGMELVASQTKVLTYLFSIIFFAVISPVGIIIGSLLASDDSTQSVPVTVIEVRKSKIYSLDRASIYWDTHYYSTTFYSILWVSSIDKMNCECSLFTSRDQHVEHFFMQYFLKFSTVNEKGKAIPCQTRKQQDSSSLSRWWQALWAWDVF